MKPALILFAHGARDARWAEPFQRLQEKLQQQYPGVVELAFLELMAPSLPQAVDKVVQGGYQAVTVIPIFFGRGGHLREDLPKLIAAIQTQHPTLQLRCAYAAGEDDTVIDALVQFCLRQR